MEEVAAAQRNAFALSAVGAFIDRVAERARAANRGRRRTPAFAEFTRSYRRTWLKIIA
jgi:hypothetical protein